MTHLLSQALLLGLALLSLPVLYSWLAQLARFVVTALPEASVSASVLMLMLVAGRQATPVWAAFGLALAPAVVGG